MALTTPTHAANQFHHVPPLQKIDRREYDGRMTWLSFMGVHSTSCEGAARHRGFCGQKGKQLSMYSTCSRSFWNKKREKRNLGSRRKSRWTKDQPTTASRKWNLAHPRFQRSTKPCEALCIEGSILCPLMPIISNHTIQVKALKGIGVDCLHRPFTVVCKVEESSCAERSGEYCHISMASPVSRRWGKVNRKGCDARFFLHLQKVPLTASFSCVFLPMANSWQYTI